MADTEITQTQTEPRTKSRNRGPRKPKENTEQTQQSNNLETSKPKNTINSNRNRRDRRPIVITPDAEGFVEIRISAGRPRDLYVESLRSAFAAETKKVVLRALGTSIPTAIFAADELFRTGVTEKFSLEADTILEAEEDEAGRTPRRAARVMVTLLRSPDWAPAQ